MVAKLIIALLLLTSLHVQCSTLAEECANISQEIYFKERMSDNKPLYYNESLGESLQNLLEDDTAVIFCTEVVMQRKEIQIANKTNISLYGLPGGHSEVHCNCSGNESAGYRFTNVTNLTLLNISFINCGILNILAIKRDTQLKGTTPWFSAVWFYFCENVTLTNIKVKNSTGTGVSFLDIVGRVEISDSAFENSNFHNKCDFSYGIYVKFSSDNWRKDIHKNRSRSCTFVFHNDSFVNNSVPSHQNPRMYSLYKTNSNERFGLGGGLTFQFEDSDSWYAEKVINIFNCTFKLNTGHHGGGMSLNFTNSTSRNNVTITHCNFTNNAGDFGGGLSLIFDNSPHNNSILYIV
jgi:hypothetical protein